MAGDGDSNHVRKSNGFDYSAFDGGDVLFHPRTKLVSPKVGRRNLIMALKRSVSSVKPRRRCGSIGATVLGTVVGFFLTTQLRTLMLHDNSIGRNSTFLGYYPCRRSQMIPVEEVQRMARLNDPLSIIGLSGSEENYHNSDKMLLFVGVMTAQKYLDTRAVAVYNTWGKELPGKIGFFSSSTSETTADIPLIALEGVDDSYPPQKKSFMMLKYMYENYGDKFEWFMRADDDVYVRTDKLEAFLRSVNSRKPQFIGQAGKGNQEEFGLLSLEYDENFCMGGPGILISRETLARVVPHVKTCLKNLYSTHEDVEIGRCVRKYAGIPCTWSYEMQTILYHNSSGNEAFTGKLKSKEVHRAITLHPVKHHRHLFRVHNYMKSLKIYDLQYEKLLLHRDIATMTSLLGEDINNIANAHLGKKSLLFPEKVGSPGYLGDPVLLGLAPGLNRFHPRSEEDVLQWDFIARSVFSASNSNPKRRMETALKEGVDDVVREIMDMINMFSRQRGRAIDFKEVLYGYHRLNPLHGSDYILDLLLVYKKYRGRKMTVPVRRHAYLQQSFVGLQIRETLDGEVVESPSASGTDSQEPAKNVLENGLKSIGEIALPVFKTSSTNKPNSIKEKVINFVLPLSGRFKIFHRFMRVFEEVCLKKDEKVRLIVVLFPNEKENSVEATMNRINSLQQLYPNIKMSVIPALDSFARALALELGAGVCTDDSLLFFVDVDMVFTSQTLERIRLNTIRGKQVYFPIVYSEYDSTVVYGPNVTSSPNNFLINQESGYWRQFGFGIASMYKSDMKKLGGFDTSIRGWGKEDVDLFEKVIASNLTLFRAADPSLVHVFHLVDCDPNLESAQLVMCHGTRTSTYGSARQLSAQILSNEDILKFARQLRNISSYS